MKKHKISYNAKGQANGLWERYHYNGKLWYKCVYYNGKEIGFEELYWYDNGKVSVKSYYL